MLTSLLARAQGVPVTCDDLGVAGAVAVLMKGQSARCDYADADADA